MSYTRDRDDEPTLGEIRERRADVHLCSTCTRSPVCFLSRDVESAPDMLVAIGLCMAYDPNEEARANLADELGIELAEGDELPTCSVGRCSHVAEFLDTNTGEGFCAVHRKPGAEPFRGS